MIRNSKQVWEVGEVVFLSLRVIVKEPTPSYYVLDGCRLDDLKGHSINSCRTTAWSAWRRTQLAGA